MSEKDIITSSQVTFEKIRHFDNKGDEYWLARELAPLLEYQQWRNFELVIKKASLACEKSGKAIEDHFADISKMVDLGSGAKRKIRDFELSRYACYLILQNGDLKQRIEEKIIILMI